jgi:hypothetical protein
MRDANADLSQNMRAVAPGYAVIPPKNKPKPASST